MGGGTLKVGGGAANWMQGDFAYNVPSWKPNMRYSNAGGRGDLLIEQPSSNQVQMGNTTNEWDLKLNNEVPTDLTAHMGAGEARLDLGALSLRSLEIEMGAGELRLDLRGKPSHSYDVRVRGGAGEATVYLPRDVGINAKASGGIGEISVRGLRAEGDHWINDAYGKSKVQLHVDIQGGVGQINVIAE
jgi:predicted membrane protein